MLCHRSALRDFVSQGRSSGAYCTFVWQGFAVETMVCMISLDVLQRTAALEQLPKHILRDLRLPVTTRHRRQRFMKTRLYLIAMPAGLAIHSNRILCRLPKISV